MSIRIFDPVIRIATVRTRMPFRYGIATMTEVPHIFVEARVRSRGRDARGLAADHLPPKWFTKNVETSFHDDLREMLAVISHAADAAVALGECATVFDAWRALYAAQQAWATPTCRPPLLWNFGVSLIERVMIDGWCRANETTLARAVRENGLGVRLHEVAPELPGTAADWLPSDPLTEIIVRHTVGLSDPLTDVDIAPGERVDDGLPQTLEECVAAHRLTHLKIKLAGLPDVDAARLRAIAELIGPGCSFTLDGNENYRGVGPLRELWGALRSDAEVASFMDGLIAIEQPLHRDVALSDSTATEFRAWADRPPLIIDESDAELRSLDQALACGYIGTSHKNCKGIFKSLINACRLQQRASLGERVLLTAEDLSNIGPIALQQDCAMVGILGIPHAERNGHHYFAGLREWPQEMQQATLTAHPDLYGMHAGFPALRVERGKIAIGSTLAAPFGYSSSLDLSRFPLIEDWRRQR